MKKIKFFTLIAALFLSLGVKAVEYVLNESTTYGRGDKGVIHEYSWTGEGAILTFDAQIGSNVAVYYYLLIEVSPDGNTWTQLAQYKDLKKDWHTDITYNVPVDARYIRFSLPAAQTLTSNKRSIRNVKVTKLEPLMTIPFEYAATAAEITHWYTFKIHTGNNARYVGTTDGSTLSFTNSNPGTNPDYLWGFVGNPVDGFQIISSEDRSKGITNADPCTVGSAASFKVYASQVSNTFCMKTGNQNFLNLQNSNKLVRWGYNDAGSSIVVNEVTIASYTITYVGIEEGDINPNPATYTALDEITLADPSRDGYNFLGWTPAGIIAKGSTGNKTFTASWELIPTSAEAGEIAWDAVAVDDTYTTHTEYGKHGTICLPYDCTVEGAVVYKYIGSDGDNLVFDYNDTNAEQSNYVTAGIAYVFFATANKQIWTKEDGAQAAAINDQNGITGTYQQMMLGQGKYFLYVQDDTFHPAGTSNNVTVPVFRAYINDLAGLVPANNAAIRALFPDTYHPVATGVENTECKMQSAKCIVNGRLVIKRGEHMYDLSGRKF